MSRPKSRFENVMSAVRRRRFSLILLSCFVNLLLLVTALYMLQIYDRVLSSGSLDTLLWLTVIALFAITVYGVLEQARRLVLQRMATFIDVELNAEVLKRSMSKRLSGEKTEATVRDVTDIRTFYKTDAALAFLDAPWSLIFIAFVWLLHPALGIIVSLGAIVLMLAALVNDLLTREKQKEAANSMRSAQEAAIQLVEGGETIKSLGMTKAIFSRWQGRQNRARTEEQELADNTTTILSFTRSFRMALQVLVLGTGAYFVLGGEITAGAMIAASIISSRALAPIDRVTSAWHRFIASRTAQARLGALFDVLSNAPDEVQLPRPAGRLSVVGLTKFAPETKMPILRNISFELAVGENCAVVGASGAGKSTLCRHLIGAWEPSHGNVRLDDADVSSWNPDELGPYIGYLPQQVELFPGTVAENIARFGETDSKAIIDAAILAGVHELILHMPNGYETDVGPHADRISIGQRQRIGLARALYGDPNFIVLDEPNSNLDGSGDQALLDALRTLKHCRRTVVVVSHRAEVLSVADKILVLDKGAVANFGDRSDILKPVEKPLHASVSDAKLATENSEKTKNKRPNPNAVLNFKHVPNAKGEA